MVDPGGMTPGQRATNGTRHRYYLAGVDVNEHVSGELSDSLARTGGFALRVPRVYRGSEPEVGVFVFRNDQPDPSQLIRQVAVTRRPSGEVEMTPEAALQWRSEIASRTTSPPQLTDSLQSGIPELTVGDRPAVQAQATDRAHRIGRQNRLIARRYIAFSTIEERIEEIKKKKQVAL